MKKNIFHQEPHPSPKNRGSTPMQKVSAGSGNKVVKSRHKIESSAPKDHKNLHRAPAFK